MMLAILVVVLLVAVNALYVAAEFASVGVRRTRVDELAEQGNRLARRLAPIVSDPRRLDVYIAACQIGITVSGLVLGAYGQHVLAGHLETFAAGHGHWGMVIAQSGAAAVVLVALTAFQVVFGELIPKAIATRYPSRVALLTLPPVLASLSVFSGTRILWLLNGSAGLLLRAFGVPLAPRHRAHVPEEIDILVEESHEGGMLDDEERQRLHNVFRLAGRRAREVMIPRPRVFAVDLDTPTEELLSIATDSAFTRIPVYRETLDNVLGVVHVKDLLAASAAGDKNVCVESLMREMPRVLESMPVPRLLSDLRARHLQMALVVDEYGGTSGIVTLEDLLEEVVGDIPDEYQKAPLPEVEEMPDGTYRVPGSMLIDDLNDRFGLHINYEEADTVAGLVMGLLGRIPQAGDEVVPNGCSLRVEEMKHNTVDTARLAIAVEAGEDG